MKEPKNTKEPKTPYQVRFLLKREEAIVLEKVTKRLQEKRLFASKTEMYRAFIYFLDNSSDKEILDFKTKMMKIES